MNRHIGEIVIAWLKGDLPMAERHAYAVEFYQSPPSEDQLIRPNDPGGYKTLCGLIAPRLLKIGRVGEGRVLEFILIPKCEKCQTLEPLDECQKRQIALDWERFGDPGLKSLESS